MVECQRNCRMGLLVRELVSSMEDYFLGIMI